MADDDTGRRSPLGAAGRIAGYPARVAARASRGPLEAAVEDHIVPEVSRIADRALAGELPEQLARSVAEHQVLERMAEELAESGALDSMVDRALASPRTEEIVQRVVASPAVQQAIRDVVSSPEVIAAIRQQSEGLVEGLAADISQRGNDLDDRIESVVRRRPVAEFTYAGVASRAGAFAIDLFAIAAIFALAAGVLALVSYLVGGLGPSALVGGVLGGGAALIAWIYFVAFWNGAGRTPGMHLIGLRVRDARDGPPSFGRSVARALLTWFSIAILFLGYIPVLFDRRRRGLPDLVAGTEVVYGRRPTR